MKKLVAISLAGSSLLFGGYSAKADWDYWAVDYSGDANVGNRIFTCNTNTAECTQRSTKLFNKNGWYPQSSFVNEDNELVIFAVGGVFHTYDLDNDTWTDSTPLGNYQGVYSRGAITNTNNGGAKIELGEKKIIETKKDGSVQIGADGNDIDVVEDGLNIDGAAVITKNADGSIQIGADGNDIDITAEGLNVDGNPIITKKDNGEIHISKN